MSDLCLLHIPQIINILYFTNYNCSCPSVLLTEVVFWEGMQESFVEIRGYSLILDGIWWTIDENSICTIAVLLILDADCLDYNGLLHFLPTRSSENRHTTPICLCRRYCCINHATLIRQFESIVKVSHVWTVARTGRGKKTSLSCLPLAPRVNSVVRFSFSTDLGVVNAECAVHNRLPVIGFSRLSLRYIIIENDSRTGKVR